MNITLPMCELGGYDIGPLRDCVLGLPEGAWLGDTFCQAESDLCRSARFLVMVFCDGSGWPDIELRRESGWSLLAEHAVPLIDRVLADHYPPGGTILRAAVARLDAGGVIELQPDKRPPFQFAHEIHVPLCTNDQLRSTIAGVPGKLSAGTACELNNQVQREVINEGGLAFIDLVFDYLTPRHLGQGASEGTGSGHARPGHERPGHARPGHERPGHARPGHERPRSAGIS